MLEPDKNPNPKLMVDPPGWLRHVMRRQFDKVTDLRNVNRRREKAEKKRLRSGDPHVVEYFHQLDDPYSHLTAQVLAIFAERYDVVIKPHLIRASGGKNQPEAEKLAAWARRDAELIAPYYGLEFPADAPGRPMSTMQNTAGLALSQQSDEDFIASVWDTSAALWNGTTESQHEANIDASMEKGSARLTELGHYSGATFYYGGEWYWGVDRLFHLEQRLRDLGACKESDLPFICPRPDIDMSGVDASGLTLDFYPSLNSPLHLDHL